MAKGTNFLFGKHASRESPDMIPENFFEKGTLQGSRDPNNSTVQTAAMGQIPRSTERILVNNATHKVIKKIYGCATCRQQTTRLDVSIIALLVVVNVIKLSAVVKRTVGCCIISY